MLSRFAVGVIVDVDVVPLDAAADVLGHVFHSIDHQMAPNGDHAGIHSNRVACRRQGAGAGAPSPAFGTASARAVSRGLKGSQGYEGAAVSDRVLERLGKRLPVGGKADGIDGVRKVLPDDLHMETVVSCSFSGC